MYDSSSILTLANVVSLYLVTPVNQALEEIQLTIIRTVIELKRKAIIKAQTLAAKALMKILGKLGA